MSHMSPARHAYVVVTFSPQPSVAEFLTRIARDAGFLGEATSTPEDLSRAVATTVPDAVLYDVGFPFTENWRRLTQLRNQPEMRCVPFVVTTADAHELYRRVGASAIELFRKPDNLSGVRAALLDAIMAAA